MLKEAGWDGAVGLVSGVGVATLRTPDWRGREGTFIIREDRCRGYLGSFGVCGREAKLQKEDN